MHQMTSPSLKSILIQDMKVSSWALQTGEHVLPAL